jgi:hypothetical protein
LEKKPALGTKNKGGFFSSNDFARLRLAAAVLMDSPLLLLPMSPKKSIFLRLNRRKK